MAPWKAFAASCLLLGVVYTAAGKSVTCKAGVDLAAAMADPQVDTAYLLGDISLREQDWTGDTWPIHMHRNFTVIGNVSRPVTLDMGFVRPKVRMGNGTTLAFRGVVVTNFRTGSFNQAPGLDLLAPMGPGEQAIVWTSQGGIIIRACFPLAVAVEAADILSRRPDTLPGTNVLVPYDPPPGCVNSTSVPALERCYVYGGRYVDVAGTGADLSPTGSPVPNGYLLYSTDVLVLCASVMSDECIARLGPLGCALYTFSLSPPPAAPAGPAGGSGGNNSAPPDSSGSAASPDSSTGGSGGQGQGTGPEAGRKQRVLGAALGGGIGGGLLIAAAVLAVVLWRRQRRQQRQRKFLQEALGVGGGLHGGRSLLSCCCCCPDACAPSWLADKLKRQASTGTLGSDRPTGDSEPAFPRDPDSPPYGGVRQACTTASAVVLREKPAPQETSGPDSGTSLSSTLKPGPGVFCRQQSASLQGQGREEVLKHAGFGQREIAGGEPGGDFAANDASGVGGGVALSRPASGREQLGSVAASVVSPLTPHREDLQLGVRLVPASAPPAAAPVPSPARLPSGDAAAAPTGGARGATAVGAGAPGGAASSGGANDAGAAASVVTLLPHVLGKGAFGCVYEGLYQGARVAVKVLRSDVADRAAGGWGAAPGPKAQAEAFLPGPSATPEPSAAPPPPMTLQTSSVLGTGLSTQGLEPSLAQPRPAQLQEHAGAAMRHTSHAGGSPWDAAHEAQQQGAPAAAAGPAAALQCVAVRAAVAGSSASSELATAQSCPTGLETLSDEPQDGLMTSSRLPSINTHVGSAPTDGDCTGGTAPRTGASSVPGSEPHRLRQGKARAEQQERATQPGEDALAAEGAGPVTAPTTTSRPRADATQSPGVPASEAGRLATGVAKSYADLFASEVAVLGRCDHRNVVRLLAACLTPPRLCLVMELCETSLERMIYGGEGGGGSGASGGGGGRGEMGRALIPLPKLLHIGIQICQGLEYLHPTIVHRDLKPANVLITGADTDRPTAKLADFGLARIREATLPTINPEAGTPAYVAPECYEVKNDVLTHRVDMYSLGVLLWAMLTGQRPWQGYSVVAVAYKVAVLHERLPLDHLPDRRCPPKLRRLIRQCWETDPHRRPAAAEAVKQLALVQEALKRDTQRGPAASPGEKGPAPGIGIVPGGAGGRTAVGRGLRRDGSINAIAFGGDSALDTGARIGSMQTASTEYHTVDRTTATGRSEDRGPTPTAGGSPPPPQQQQQVPSPAPPHMRLADADGHAAAFAGDSEAIRLRPPLSGDSGAPGIGGGSGEGYTAQERWGPLQPPLTEQSPYSMTAMTMSSVGLSRTALERQLDEIKLEIE